ncbi:MAG: toll/interleukin-1 receptor domain-containing protein [Rhodobacteraceae bacterium]|nr:toll/interleukin-1 receptor domain-containing protein [Paracoccaceae bacterium]
MSDFPYQIGLLGDCGRYKERLRSTFEQRFEDLGFQLSDFRLLCGTGIAKRNRRAPFAAMYFGHDDAHNDNAELLEDVLSDSPVVLPVVDDLSNFSAKVHPLIWPINGVEIDPHDTGFERDVGAVIESFRLLRKDRRLFVSYKRDDARQIAVQLYEALDERGFDVFLDTHGVPPGEDFQSVLWHRLADSDVVVVLDAPHFFESRWTQEELARAHATSVQVLHLLWPGRTASNEAALNSFLPLKNSDFSGQKIDDEAQLVEGTVEKIAVKVESLRARALAARHRFLVDSFCKQARSLGFDIEVQPTRHLVFRRQEKKGVVTPLVGVPSAERLHEVHQAFDDTVIAPDSVWALYDNRGLLPITIDHLNWLNVSLPVKAISTSDVARELRNEAQT